MRLLETLPLFALLAVSTACPGEGTNTDSGCFAGDPDAGPEIVVIHQNANGTVETTLSGGTVPLVEPPQGGRVLFIGARAKNMDGCPINISTALIDECTGLVVGFEGRDILMKPNADGWIEPEFPAQLANYSNLAACPVAQRDRAVNDQLYTLEVRLTDRAQRTVTTELPVRPVCGEPGQLSECLCLCRAHYVLGECPQLDGGTSTSTRCP